MSLFVTNRATRRGKRAKTEFYSYDNARASGTIPGKDTTIQTSTPNKHVHGGLELRPTTIGGQHSSGLTIQGGLRERPWQRGTNPDDRTDVILGKTGEDDGKVDEFPNEFAAEPVYPITFSGPGYMQFKSSIGIPSVRGDMEIGNNLKVNNNITVDQNIILGGDLTDPSGVSLIPVAPTQGTFTPTLEDTSANQATLTTANGAYSREGDFVHYEIELDWTSLGSMTGEIRINNLPFTSTHDTVFGIERSHGMLVSEIGNYFSVIYPDGADYLIVRENYAVTGDACTAITTNNLLSAGRLFVNGTSYI